VVHFLNKGGRRGIPWRRSSQRGKGVGVAGGPDHQRQRFFGERDEESIKNKGGRRKTLIPGIGD
jgi:hypothetical protein